MCLWMCIFVSLSLYVCLCMEVWLVCFFTPRALRSRERYVRARSIWDQCKKKYILRTDRPTDQPHTWENFKWPYLCEGSFDPFPVWFYGGVIGVADRMALFPVCLNPSRHLGKFKWRYLRDGSSDLLRVWSYGGVFAVGQSNSSYFELDQIQ